MNRELVGYHDLIRELRMAPEALLDRFGIALRDRRQLYRLDALRRAAERTTPPAYPDDEPFTVWVVTQGDLRAATMTSRSEAQGKAGCRNELLPEGQEAAVIETRRAILLPRSNR